MYEMLIVHEWARRLRATRCDIKGALTHGLKNNQKNAMDTAG
jgi:hypothetical protein